MKEALVEFWKRNETKIILLIGLVLVSWISFQGGYLKGRTIRESPLIIEKTANCPNSSETSQNNQPDQAKTEAASDNSEAKSNLGAGENKNCAYVGSKNSNKYHLSSCRYAKTIKPENLVCFVSAEEAGKRGYQPDSNCIK